MEPEEVRKRLEAALRQLEENNSHLFEDNLSERCIASRLAMYLQNVFPEFSVDVEYNRKGVRPKTLDLPEECANYQTKNGEVLVLPDIIVHRRGEEGPNILALELKKTTNPGSRECDHMRIHAFREQLNYGSAAFVECETRPGRKPSAAIAEWL
jgi:hypothetical protein